MIGLPSEPAAVPFLVCRSGGVCQPVASCFEKYREEIHTALTNSCVKDFSQNFILASYGDRVLLKKLDIAAEGTNQGDGLDYWDLFHAECLDDIRLICNTLWKGEIEVIYIHTCPFLASASCIFLQVILADHELGDVAPE